MHVRPSLPPSGIIHLCIIKMEVLCCKKLRPPLQEGVSPLSEDAMLDWYMYDGCPPGSWTRSSLVTLLLRFRYSSVTLSADKKRV